MRKGFTQTLTALATVLLATSAMALGPLVSNVPDVFISSADDTSVNMFRYTDALVLWDYVTPGVASGTGSTSDTLYWTWAAKNADYATGLGTGSFLSPSADPLTDTGIHYSIAQQNGTVVSPIQPAGTNIVEWTPDINAAPGLATHGLNVAGALTFRNIRLSPPPDQASYPAPVAMPATLPTGVLDFQEATLFVTDGVTSPQGADTALLVSVDTGVDRLSGGPSWVPGADVTGNASWAVFSIYAPSAGQGIAPTVPSPGILGTKPTATSVGVNCTQLANPNWDATHDAYNFGVWNPNASDATIFGTANPFAAGTLYRLSATIATSNANAANNGAIYVGLNARASGVGYGYTLINQGVAAPIGPVSGSPVVLNGYLVPSMAGDAPLWLGVYDPPAISGLTTDAGGIITFSNLTIRQVDLNSLVKVSDRVPLTTTFNSTSFTYFGFAYAFFNASSAIVPAFSHTPVSGSGVASLTGAMSSTLPLDNNRGYATLQFQRMFQPQTVGDLLVAKAMLTGTGSGKLPDVLLRVQDTALNYQGSFWVTPNATSGPGASARPYYVVMDVPPGKAAQDWDFDVYITVDDNTVNGTITMQSLTISEYQQPK